MFCTNCGSQIDDAATFCPHCGAPTSASAAPQNGVYEQNPTEVRGLRTAAKVFIIIGMIFGFWTILPLIFGYLGLKELKKPVPSIGIGVCVLLFCNLIGGILMLCVSNI